MKLHMLLMQMGMLGGFVGNSAVGQPVVWNSSNSVLGGLGTTVQRFALHKSINQLYKKQDALYTFLMP